MERDPQWYEKKCYDIEKKEAKEVYEVLSDMGVISELPNNDDWWEDQSIDENAHLHAELQKMLDERSIEYLPNNHINFQDALTKEINLMKQGIENILTRLETEELNTNNIQNTDKIQRRILKLRDINRKIHAFNSHF